MDNLKKCPSCQSDNPNVRWCIEDYEDSGKSMPCDNPFHPPRENRVQFISAVSGLKYSNPAAAGEISEVEIDGVRFVKAESKDSEVANIKAIHYINEVIDMVDTHQHEPDLDTILSRLRTILKALPKSGDRVIVRLIGADKDMGAGTVEKIVHDDGSRGSYAIVVMDGSGAREFLGFRCLRPEPGARSETLESVKRERDELKVALDRLSERRGEEIEEFVKEVGDLKRQLDAERKPNQLKVCDKHKRGLTGAEVDGYSGCPWCAIAIWRQSRRECEDYIKKIMRAVGPMNCDLDLPEYIAEMTIRLGIYKNYAEVSEKKVEAIVDLIRQLKEILPIHLKNTLT